MSGARSAIDIFEVRAVEAVLAPDRWAFAAERAVEIDRHWAAARTKNPAIFDGPILLAAGLARDRDVLRVTYLRTSFRPYLAWADWGHPEAGVVNCYPMAALRATDGAYLLAEQGQDSVNAARINFCAGMVDLQDVVDGSGVDLARNVLRELGEEMGLMPDDVALEPGWTVVAVGRSVACMKGVRVAMDADALARRITATLRGQLKPELARVHLVRSIDGLAGLPVQAQTRAYLARAFGRSVGPQPAG